MAATPISTEARNNMKSSLSRFRRRATASIELENGDVMVGSSGFFDDEKPESFDNEGKIGVLLLNLGGPGSLEDVQPFLYNLFADPDIIRLPEAVRFLQRPSHSLPKQTYCCLPNVPSSVFLRTGCI